MANINPYLLDAPNVWIGNRNTPVSDIPEMLTGNKPIDDGNYLFTPEEKAEFLIKEPNSESFFQRYVGGAEMLNNIERWCLWLGNAKPNELAKLPECQKRVAAVKKFRSDSKSKPTQKLADTPRRFHIEFMPEGNYLAVPQVSSERRRFIPIGFLDKTVLPSSQLKIVPNASLYHFGIMSSSMHNAFMRTVAGRLESRFRYSINVVYNNFPWPESIDNKNKTSIEAKAQAVLDARMVYPESTLAELYNPETMPDNLAKAHKELDKAVDKAYRYTGKPDDADRVAFLFERYQALVEAEAQAEKQKKSRKKAD